MDLLWCMRSCVYCTLLYPILISFSIFLFLGSSKSRFLCLSLSVILLHVHVYFAFVLLLVLKRAHQRNMTHDRKISSLIDFLIIFIHRNNTVASKREKWPPSAAHYIFVLWFLSSFFLLSSFFPRLISAVGDWMALVRI